jgi:xanthine dehydrogenase accessory factor
MSLDAGAIRAAVAERGAVVRIVVAAVKGSAPREEGAAMLVWEGGQSGTIGGGALEWTAAARAREMLREGAGREDNGREDNGREDNGREDMGREAMRLPLGPSLGQCCGGAVTLVLERWDGRMLPLLEERMLARPLPGAGEMPLAVRRALSEARGQGMAAPLRLTGGWLLEPVTPAAQAVWLWGAGHVGRAVAAVLAPLPGFAVTWADTARARFPETIPEGVTMRIADAPGALVAEAPEDAWHVVMTFSHALDLDLCHRILGRGFGALHLIGSATKRARFESRLCALGHGAAEVSRIVCPIGEPGLGKHPQAIAVGLAVAFLREAARGAGRGAQPRRAAKGAG